jgi:hypothetical protein
MVEELLTYLVIVVTNYLTHQKDIKRNQSVLICDSFLKRYLNT